MRDPSATFLALLLIASFATAQDRQRERAPRPPAGELQRLALPLGAPQRFEVDLEVAGAPVRIRLEKHSLRTEGAVLRTWVADGEGGRYVDGELPPVRTYRGSVLGVPGSVVLASLGDDGLGATILLGAETFELRPEGGGLHRRVERDHDHGLVGACGVIEDPDPGDLAEAARLASSGAPARRGLTRAEVAFDADYEFFLRYGSSTSAVVGRIEAMVNEVDYFYARDVLITHGITGVVVRTAPFYTPTGGGNLLDQFRIEWETSDPVLPRDIGHLMTGKPGSLIEYGGLAYVGVVCGGASYGWSMDSANIVAHELGHNWASGHCHDRTPCNHMCGGCFFVGPKTKRIMEAHRDSRACVDGAPPYGTPVPPYVHPARLALAKKDFVPGSEVRFDVTRTAHDANGDLFRLESFSRTSEHGATLWRSIGTGARGQDEVVYVFPDTPWIGQDRVAFTVVDATGLRTEGEITVDLRRADPEAHYPFDEGAGATAADVSGRGRTATAPNGASWIDSPTGTGAIAFDGTTQVLESTALVIDPPWTVSTWIRRLPSVGPVSALAESADGSLRTEQWGTAQALGLTRFGVADASFGYFLPVDTWTHATFVGTENRTEFFVNGFPAGEVPFGIQAPTRPAASAVEPLRAGLDDFRVYGYGLEPGEIFEVILGGLASNPQPPDGGRVGASGETLTWRPGLGAESHDVYFGESWSAVNAATPASPEFVGNQAGVAFPTGRLEDDRTYYWRVDTRRAATVAKGNVWQFQLAERLRWRLDEGSGSLAAEETGAFHGTYLGGIQQGQPGATALLSNSVRLDGVNDRVRLPALGLDTNRFTLTGWIRRDGAQPDYAGLFFSRAGGTVAGLNLSTAHQLGYHWNGDPATYAWDSGLIVPEGTWVFVALVVEPERARLHLGSGGTLSTATNAVPHAPEEFDGILNLGIDVLGGRAFAGWMDDVRVFDAALTTEAVESLFLDSQ